MSEMVEKVARALCRQYEIEDGFSPEQADRAAESGMWRNFRDAACAAIGAMREPTAAMTDAGYIYDHISSGDAKDCWQAMIDAALK